MFNLMLAPFTLLNDCSQQMFAERKQTPKIGLFAIANKYGGAHRVFFVMLRVPYIAHHMSDKGSIGRYWGHVTIQ